MQQSQLNELVTLLKQAGLDPMLCDCPVSFIDTAVCAGIPTEPGEHTRGEYILLPTELVGMHPVFVIPVKGQSMKDADLLDGDQSGRFREDQRSSLCFLFCGGTAGRCAGAFPDQQSTADNWIDRIDGPIADYDPLKTLYKKTIIKSCIANDYSEMSELERVEFVKNMLSNNHNVAIQTILSLEEVKKATDINTLCNALSKAINDKSLKDKVSKDPRISGPAFQMPGSFAHTPTATNEIWSAQSIIYLTSDIAKTFKDCPLTPKPEPEPVVEKPKWFETTSKDHQVRIEQWMEHVGMKDQAQALIDKYGLPVAYEIVQTSMQAPADLKEASDGTFRSSKGSIQYFLENEVSAEKLVNIRQKYDF